MYWCICRSIIYGRIVLSSMLLLYIIHDVGLREARVDLKLLIVVKNEHKSLTVECRIVNFSLNTVKNTSLDQLLCYVRCNNNTEIQCYLITFSRGTCFYFITKNIYSDKKCNTIKN